MRAGCLVLLLGMTLDPATAVTLTTDITPQSPQPDRGLLKGQYSPNGQHYCEVADHFTDGAFELACAPVYPPTPMIRISGQLLSGQIVEELIFLDDGQSVVYSARQDALDREDLYLAALDGSGTPTRLTDPSVAASSLVQVEYSATNDMLVFRRDPTVGSPELVLLTLSPALETVIPLPGGDGLGFIVVAPDESFVVVNTTTHLYQVSLPGGAVTELDSALQSASYAADITADSQTVVFSATKFDGAKRELYSVPSGGGAVHLLSPPALPSVAGGLAYELSGDSQWVAFMAATGTMDADWVFSLFVSPVRGAGSFTTVANDYHRCPFSMCSILGRLAVNDQSSKVVSLASTQPGNSQTTYNLVSAPLDGSALVTTLDNAVNSRTLSVLSDQAAAVVTSSSDLVLYDLNGGPSVNLTPALGGFSSFSLYSEQLQRVIFRNIPDSGNEAIHAVSIDGGGRVKLSDTSPFATGLCETFDRLMATGQHVLKCETSSIFLPPFGLSLFQSLVRVDVVSGHAVTVASNSWDSGDSDVPDFRKWYASSTDPQQVTYAKWETSGGPTNTFVGDIDVLFVGDFNPPQ